MSNLSPESGRLLEATSSSYGAGGRALAYPSSSPLSKEIVASVYVPELRSIRQNARFTHDTYLEEKRTIEEKPAFQIYHAWHKYKWYGLGVGVFATGIVCFIPAVRAPLFGWISRYQAPTSFSFGAVSTAGVGLLHMFERWPKVARMVTIWNGVYADGENLKRDIACEFMSPKPQFEGLRPRMKALSDAYQKARSEGHQTSEEAYRKAVIKLNTWEQSDTDEMNSIFGTNMKVN
jgi:hypothetical protein